MWVIKFVGSLVNSPYLKDWLKVIYKNRDHSFVVVPGGSIFADQVRRIQKVLNFDDSVAHEMALHAMEQYGHLLCSMQPGFRPAETLNQIQYIISDDAVPVWFPCNMLSGNSVVPASWDVTSDSLALWLTEQLGYKRLLFLKSIIPDRNIFKADYLSQSGYLDKAFVKMFNSDLVKPVWISHEQLNMFDTLISEENNKEISYIE